MTTTTETPIETAIETTIDTYLEAYGERDAARRDALIRQVWAADGALIDPPLDGAGHDGISALTDIVEAYFPGHTFRRSSGIDAHHAFARYEWELVAPVGVVAMVGTDVVELTAAGAIQRVVGFFGPLPDKG